MEPSITDPQIRNRVRGLNFCFEKLDEKLTPLMVLQESSKGNEDQVKSSMDVILKLKSDLEDLKQRMNELLMQYNQGAVDHDGTMNQLKELIIEVYKTKSSIDLACRDFQTGANEEKDKGLINKSDEFKDSGGASSSHAGAKFEGKDLDLAKKFGFLSSSEEESEVEVDEIEKKDIDVKERILNMLHQTSSSSDDKQEVSDSEIFSTNIEGLDQELQDLINKWKTTDE